MQSLLLIEKDKAYCEKILDQLKGKTPLVPLKAFDLEIGLDLMSKNNSISNIIFGPSSFKGDFESILSLFRAININAFIIILFKRKIRIADILLCGPLTTVLHVPTQERLIIPVLKEQKPIPVESTKGLRKYQRFVFSEKIKMQAGGLTLSGNSTNISENGIFVKTNTPLKQNTVLTLDVPIKDQVLTLDGLVRWESTKDPLLGNGLQFLGDSKILMPIRDYLNEMK